MENGKCRPSVWAARLGMLAVYAVFPHVVLIVWQLLNLRNVFGPFWGMAAVAAAVCVMAVIWIVFAVFAPTRYQAKTFRLRMLLSARSMILGGAAAVVVQLAAMVIYHFGPRAFVDVPKAIVLSDNLVTLAMICLIFLNGAIRILVSSKRLDRRKRLTVIFTLWIPVVHIFTLNYLCQQVMAEYRQTVRSENTGEECIRPAELQE